ncbi:hypothetical protein [Saccharopolyspora shandongensis]|uniref:hypothetical protein n=1 Tax=Saccharopolyspora shandongensis TaxID=418495 RepID=UPI0033DBDC06
MVVLNAFLVWHDFADPRLILGAGSGIYTVIIGIYAAVGRYTTDNAVVFLTLLLATAPPLVVFMLLQRHVGSGLTTVEVKG